MSRQYLVRMPAAILLALLAGSAQATILNIDLEGSRTAGGGIGTEITPTTYSGAGAAGGGTTFNGITPTAVSDNTGSSTTGDNQTLSGSGLLDDGGAATTIGFSIGPVGIDNETLSTTATDPLTLFSDYVFNNSAGNGPGQVSTFTISGLTPGGAYDVYLYGGFGNASFVSNTSITGAP